jgi:hypothetical protein
METDHGPTPDSTARALLEFAPTVERIFSFLSDYGFRHAASEPTLVRYEGNGRYIDIFHGRRSYVLGVHIGLLDDPDAKFSLPEIAWAFGDRYYEFAGRTKESLAAAVEKLAAEVSKYPDMLNGRIPIERIQEYRQRLTDYYAGKSKVNPDQQYRNLP